MVYEQLKIQVLHDIRTTKRTDNIKMFIKNINRFSTADIVIIIQEIEENIYFGQRGVDDIAWFKYKLFLKEFVKK